MAVLMAIVVKTGDGLGASELKWQKQNDAGADLKEPPMTQS